MSFRRTRGIVAALVTVAALVAAPLAATASTSPAKTANSERQFKDLGDDMRLVPGVDIAADAAADARRRATTRAAATVDEKVYVDVVSVTAATGDDTYSLATLSQANVTAAIQSLSDYWYAETNGAVTFSLGGYDNTHSYSSGTCNPDDVFDAEASTAFSPQFSNNTWVNTHKHLLTLTRESTACGSQAFGTVGGRGGQIFDANGIGGTLGLPILDHEFGHNLGLGHADLTICTNGQKDADVSNTDYDAGDVCPTEAYGDVLDIMGYSVDNAAPHLSAMEKIYFGWLDGGYTDVTGTTATSLQLLSLNGISGNRAVRITDPLTGARYVVEYRTQEGADATSVAFAGTPGGNPGPRNEPNGYRLQLDSADPATGVVRILREVNFSGSANEGLGGDRNYTETTVLAASLAGTDSDPKYLKPSIDVGETFTSVNGGFSVTVNSANPAAGAAVTVSYPSHTSTSTFLTASRSGKQTYGSTSRVTLAAQVTAIDGSIPVNHQVTFFEGSTPVAITLVGADGFARFTLPATATAKKHSYTAQFALTPGYYASGAGPVSVTVKKASASATIKLVHGSVHLRAKAQVKVTVKVKGVAKPTGKLVAYANGKKLNTYTLGASKKGKLTITLPRSVKVGTTKIHVKYLGNSNISADTSNKKKLKVTF